MADCKICGYFIPDNAQKCVHCGQLFNGKLKKNAKKQNRLKLGIEIAGALGGFATFAMAIAIIMQSCSIGKQTGILGKQADSLDGQTKILNRQFELEYIPVVRIGSISLNAVPYTEISGDKSIAVYFSIPIENRHGFAFDVKIVEKTIDLGQKKAGLEDSSLQSSLTNSAFDLSDGQIRYDKIGIDIPNLEEYLRGNKKFTLKYRIEYKALPDVTKDIFVYTYEVIFTNGRFEVIQEETKREKKT